MKNFITCLGIGLIALWAVPTLAGDYHTGTTLICADCHVMHYSQTHGYNANGTGIYADLGQTGPYHYLLRNEINELCLSCHDNQAFAPDVFEANSNSYVRQAGGLNEVGGNNNYHEADGHTLNTTDAAPGGTWANADGMNCVNCHHQHGRGTTAIPNPYRNLNRESGGFDHEVVSYAATTNDLTKDVFETQPAGYTVDQVWFNEPLTTDSRMANWCKSCHTDFHGAKGGPEVGGATGEEWLRHPSADANIGGIGGGHSSLSRYNGLTNNVKVMSSTGVWDPAPSDVTPMCLSCHKGHGNQNSFGLIQMIGTGTVDEEGDDGTSVRALCGQCHNQAR
jgi:hypothetical protein